MSDKESKRSDTAKETTGKEKNQALKKGTTLLQVPKQAKGLPSLQPSPKKGKKRADWVREQFVKVCDTVSEEEPQDKPTEQPEAAQKLVCLHCNTLVGASNITHQKTHLFSKKCSFVTSEAARLSQEPEVVQARKARGLSKYPTAAASDTTSVQQGSVGPGPSAKRQAVSFLDRMSPEEKRKLDLAFAKMLIVTNVPFNWVEQAVVKEFFSLLRPAYTLPSRYELSQPLLFAIYSMVMEAIREKLSETLYVTITSDGWSRTQGDEHLLNYMVCCYGSAFFLDMKNAKGSSCTADFMLESLNSVMEQHELEEKTVAFISDTPSTNKKLWRELAAARKDAKQKPIIAFGCGAHCINLFCGDVLKLESCAALMSRARQIVNCFSRNALPQAMLKAERDRAACANASKCALSSCVTP